MSGRWRSQKIISLGRSELVSHNSITCLVNDLESVLDEVEPNALLEITSHHTGACVFFKDGCLRSSNRLTG
jgi:hypothetical protein